MKNSLTLLLCCLGCFLTSTLMAQSRMARSEAISMIGELTQHLLEHHPFAQQVSGARTIDSIGRQLEAQLSIVGHNDSLSLLEFLATVAPLQRGTADGHLQLVPNPSPATTDSIALRNFPLFLAEMKAGQYVLRSPLPTAMADTLPAGTPVLAIDGWRVAPLIEKMAVFGGANDNGFDRAARFHTAFNFGRNYQRLEGWRDSISILVPGSKGQEELHWVKPSRPAQKSSDQKSSKGATARQTFSLRLSEDSSAWILKVRSFSSFSFGGNRNFRKLAREYFERINASEINQLVVDLRFNTGGSLSNCSFLYGFLAEEPFPALTDISSTGPTAGGKGLWNRFGMWLVGGVRKQDGTYRQPRETRAKNRVPEKKRFDGQVVVLVNNLTFSAAGLFANYVQGYERGIIVGDVSGASNEVVYGGKTLEFPIGERELFTLKMKNWRLIPANPKPGNLTPDILVPVRAKDLSSGSPDPQLSRALDSFKS
ncbi:S41 family peptidase [Lewinella sp. W8]|uniref:S41 family peptidase n=1 Tax=Lewinella sp. W8 TaxID=2528208 RepID=UPI0010676C4D|nr:S41 family peptidase [Lewinella sp. W8]MTB53766.1 hypothetical protein [Lewinella sp. W8]